MVFLAVGLNKRHGKRYMFGEGQEAMNRLPHLVMTTLFLRPSYLNKAHALFSIDGFKHTRFCMKNTFPNKHYLPHDIA